MAVMYMYFVKKKQKQMNKLSLYSIVRLNSSIF